MTVDKPDNIDEVDPNRVRLSEAFLGYNILFDSTYVGGIEAIPGKVEYLQVVPPWENKGVARAAVREFVTLSREAGKSQVTTNNATHPAMEHILKTEGFEERTDEIGWIKKL